MDNQISKNFYLSEFACRCGCETPFKVEPSLVTLLQNIRTRIGQGLYISSGCRCPEHNASVSGAKKSWHIPRDGVLYAADVMFYDPTNRNERSALWLYALAESIGQPGGLGLYNNRVHIDQRPVGIMKGQDRKRWLDKGFKPPL